MGKELIWSPASHHAFDVAAHEFNLAAFTWFDRTLAIPFGDAVCFSEERPGLFRRGGQEALELNGGFRDHLSFAHRLSFRKACSSASSRGVQKAWMRDTQSDNSATPSGSSS